MKRFLAVMLALIVVLAFALPVSADSTKKETQHYDYVYKVGDCPNFALLDHIVYDVITKTAPNNKLIFHVQGVDNIYNEAKPDGLVIPGSFIWNATWDLTTGEIMVHGLYIHITMPGLGSVFFDSGKAMFVPAEGSEDLVYVPLAGHHELDAKFCKVLGGS